jgi:hypothetical protein
MVRLGAATVLAAGLTACGGGGGGDSSDDVDLRAAYDRINRDCMTIAEVERAVGRSADETPSNSRRRWVSGNQSLSVTFAQLNSITFNSGTFVANGATWDIVPGGELEKGFQLNCPGV